MRLSRDVERADFRPKQGSWTQGSALSMGGVSAYSYSGPGQQRRLRRWLDSFRRDPGRRVTPASVMNAAEDRSRASMQRRSDDVPPLERARSSHYFDLHAANVNTANTLLSRELKGRHLQMIAIGGSIGRYSCGLSAVLRAVCRKKTLQPSSECKGASRT